SYPLCVSLVISLFPYTTLFRSVDGTNYFFFGRWLSPFPFDYIVYRSADYIATPSVAYRCNHGPSVSFISITKKCPARPGNGDRLFISDFLPCYNCQIGRASCMERV